MRLGTCIALELTVAAATVAGVWFGVGAGMRLAGDYVVSQQAVAATSVEPARTRYAVPARLPQAHLEVEVPAGPSTVFEASDAELLAPLAITPVSATKINHGGTSLSLRVEFANGSRAAFKPEQVHYQSDPRNEIAAYRIDRLLAIGHVPPAKAATLSVDELIAGAEPSHRRYIADRLRDEGIAHAGAVRGVVSWWIPEIRVARLDGLPIDDQEGKARWTSYLQIGATIPEAARPMVAQIAAVVVFDVLIDNPDRWSGANARMSPDGETLYFMDNTLSFSNLAFGHRRNLLAVRRLTVFPRGLIARVRALTRESIVAVLETGDHHGLAPLIQPGEVRAILSRRDNLITYIDQLIATHGEDTVLALP